MRFLVIGLGSMGKRRVRNLQALGHRNVAGFDPHVDRRNEAADKYGSVVYPDFATAAEAFRPDVLII